MKTFMERTRPQHMVANAFKGKVGGMVATAGLSDCGVEETLAAMDRWFATQEMLVVHPRPEGPVLGSGAAATQYAGFNAEKGRSSGVASRTTRWPSMSLVSWDAIW